MNAPAAMSTSMWSVAAAGPVATGIQTGELPRRGASAQSENEMT